MEDQNAQSRLSSFISKTNKPFIVGHRGASDSYPENTILSIEQAINDGVDAIEFDIRLTLDDEIIILHDSSLDRTTTGKGEASTRNFHGYIEFLTTKEQPHCNIPRFQDILEVFLKQKDSKVWAVIDVKLENSPRILMVLSTLLKQHDYLSRFMDRFILGIWHPKFLSVARQYLPELPIVYIGYSLNIARKYFSDVDGYNISFIPLCNNDGENFINVAHELSKPVFAWTVNSYAYADDCNNCKVDAILTDKAKDFINYYRSGEKNNNNSWWPTWGTYLLYSTLKFLLEYLHIKKLKKYGELDV
ncbi:PLC-like phosphodiesterase [Gigaspora margarita]|uniref:PLC-like phosphodiesterase n=1 Tax=Gigaspora margarita TaxID=4874 RepID=A0A8H4A477_GIGMA|nr:PLC-like phosphodiesterase [Gigaspora margarita]